MLDPARFDFIEWVDEPSPRVLKGRKLSPELKIKFRFHGAHRRDYTLVTLFDADGVRLKALFDEVGLLNDGRPHTTEWLETLIDSTGSFSVKFEVYILGVYGNLYYLGSATSLSFTVVEDPVSP